MMRCRHFLAISILMQTIFIIASSSSDNIEITLDGSQYIEKSMIVNPSYRTTSELSIIFKTSISSGLLFYASGLTGDFIAMELVHGKIRYTANSDGLSKTRKPIEIIYGTNYADGRYHQVNVEIGEYTELYTYTFPEGKSNTTRVRSTAKDLRYDLDEMAYYAGLPITQRAITRDILSSRANFRGCINVLTFNRELLDISESAFKAKTSPFRFHGNYIKGCTENEPKFLKSFSTESEKLVVYSHMNRNLFKTDFYYRTYLQTATVLSSKSTEEKSSLSLNLHNNHMRLTVNLTLNDSITITHFNGHADDGTWRRVRVDVTPEHIEFAIDNTTTKYSFNQTKHYDFPHKIVFGKEESSKSGFVGCIKDVYLGKEMASINKIMNLNLDIKYEEKQCAMKDYCLPSKPCHNKGRCIQTPTKAVCDCKGTGYTGQICQLQNTHNLYKRSCAEYFKMGYQDNGIFVIKPGSSRPFKVFCDMENKDGPKTIIKTNTKSHHSAVRSTTHDTEYYYHMITYKASKQQIAELIAVSQTCRQYVRYDCIASSLLNSFKTERSSDLGVRWYSRKGFLRKYWHGDQSTAKKESCRCGLEGNCLSPDVLCNCDIRAGKFQYDDGYLSDKDDLPISKLRISKQRTNVRSSFRLGDLECSNNVNVTNAIPSFTPDLVVTDRNGVQVHETTSPYSNNTDIKESKKKSKNFVLIDTKLLYGIIIAVVLLISLLLLILILKRRLCCCYYENKAKPQIVEIYKDTELGSHRNNNKNNFQLSNDVTLHNNDVMTSLKRGMTPTYPASCSSSSVSTIDPSRYYQHDAIDFNALNNIIPPEPPKRTVLKIKKDLGQHQSSSSVKRNSGESQQNLSSSSETSVTKPKLTSKPQQTQQTQDTTFSTTTKPYVAKKRDFVVANDGDNTGLSPLKQKILEMSTSRQRLHSGELYFHHQDSTMKSSTSSSRSTSKESDINTDVESMTDMSELLPMNKCQQQQQCPSSKNVRFNEEEKNAFYAHMYRNKSAGNKPTKRTISEYDDSEYLFGDEALV